MKSKLNLIFAIVSIVSTSAMTCGESIDLVSVISKDAGKLEFALFVQENEFTHLKNIKSMFDQIPTLESYASIDRDGVDADIVRKENRIEMLKKDVEDNNEGLRIVKGSSAKICN